MLSGLLFGLGLLSAVGWGCIFPKWPPLEEHTLMNIPKSFASNALPPQQAIVTLCFPRRSPKNCSRVWPRFLWSPCFALGPSARESLCAPFKNGVSISPSPVELLHTSPTGLQCQMLWGLFLPMPDPQVWGFDVGLRTLTPIGECLWYSYFLVFGFPTQEVWGCLYHVISPPTSWCGFFFVFWSRMSFWKFPVHLIECCSAFGCSFVVFMRDIELQSFYSAILICSDKDIFHSCYMSME